MDEYGGAIESTGVARTQKYNWEPLVTALFKKTIALPFRKSESGGYDDSTDEESDEWARVKSIHVGLPRSDTVYTIVYRGAAASNSFAIKSNKTKTPLFLRLWLNNEDFAFMSPAGPSTTVDITNRDMPYDFLRFCMRILTLPEASKGDEAGYAKMAKKIGWGVEAVGYSF